MLKSYETALYDAEMMYYPRVTSLPVLISRTSSGVIPSDDAVTMDGELILKHAVTMLE
jgi:hypothetical protein